MTCNMGSTVAVGQLNVPVTTPVGRGKTDAQNLTDHCRDIGLAPGADQGTSISTSWPGLPTPVVTTKRPDETWAEFVIRHQERCIAAAGAHPIDCP